MIKYNGSAAPSVKMQNNPLHPRPPGAALGVLGGGLGGGLGPGPGGGLGPGPSEQPPVQAAHVSKVYVYSQLPGRLTAVHASGTSGPVLPSLGHTKATVT